MIELAAALKEAVERTVTEMVRAHETSPKVVAGFPSTKVSFSKPDGLVLKVLKREDLPYVDGLKKDQEIYVYQED